MEILNMYCDDLQKLNSVLNSFIILKTIPSLGSILGEPVAHHIRKTQEISITNLDLIISNLEEMNVMSAVYVKCGGDLRMSMLLYMPEGESKTLAAKLLDKLSLNELNGITTSSISEIGNILTASIVNALSIDTGYKICSSVPGYAVEFFGTLLDAMVSDFENESDTLIVSNVELYGLDSGIRMHILLIQDPAEVKKLVM
jgi:chemotaxis protein CheC